jgi:antitoxin component YwqK of YwqJK toxin-antitoxin module
MKFTDLIKFIILPLILISCENNYSEPIIPESNIEGEIISVNEKEPSKVKDSSITINEIKEELLNTNQLKQGEIIKRNHQGKIKSIENYKNDTLNGYFFKWEGMQRDGFYKMGKKDGFFRTYYGKKEEGNVMLVSFFRNDTLMWNACPASDEQYIYNPKGFHSPFDSIYIEVPRPDGTIWYEGLFIKNQETGKHKINNKNGELYAIADYEKNLVYFADKDTVSLKEYGFKKIEE